MNEADQVLPDVSSGGEAAPEAPGVGWLFGWVLLVGFAWILGEGTGVFLPLAIGLEVGDLVDELDASRGAGDWIRANLRFLVLRVLQSFIGGVAVGGAIALMTRGRLPHSWRLAVLTALAFSLGAVVSHIAHPTGYVLFSLAFSLSSRSSSLLSGLMSEALVGIAFAFLTALLLASVAPRLHWWVIGAAVGLVLAQVPVALAIWHGSSFAVIGAYGVLVEPFIFAVVTGVAFRQAVHPGTKVSVAGSSD